MSLSYLLFLTVDYELLLSFNTGGVVECRYTAPGHVIKNPQLHKKKCAILGYIAFVSKTMSIEAALVSVFKDRSCSLA